MDLSNFIDNKTNKQFQNDFNTQSFDFSDIQGNKLEQVADQVVINDYNQEQLKYNIFRELFTCLANGFNAKAALSNIERKFGSSVITDELVTLANKFDALIGNYIITCRYNDNKGKNNPQLVKYCMFCDCPDNEAVVQKTTYDNGNIDGFFNDNGNTTVKTIKICKKHNLPVLSKVSDLTEDEFVELAEKVAQIKNVSKKDLDKTASTKKTVIGKIRSVFAKLKPQKVQAKIDVDSYKMTDANTDATVTVGCEFKNASINDVVKPKMNSIKVSKEENVKSVNVKVPVNNIDVKISKNIQAGKTFSISPTRVSFDVEKESKMVDNISIYTKPVNDLDMEEDLTFTLDVSSDNFDSNNIDVKNDFNF